MVPTPQKRSVLSRRSLCAGGLALGAVSLTSKVPARAQEGAPSVVRPPRERALLVSCKLGMIAREHEGKPLDLVGRLRLAAEAGFDGVDLDEAADVTPEAAREAVARSGVFVHGAIDHAHWRHRLSDADPEQRARGRANLEHCLRVSHAAGGSGVLIVLGHGNDGPEAEIEARVQAELRAVLPLAAALGQRILVENVWNRLHYDHDGGPEQGPERFVRFLDALASPWVGMYYDVGNHWKYGRPGAWIRALGARCVKLDLKGFSRARGEFVELTGEHDDIPWHEVREALAEIGFCGWATAEVGGGGLERLTLVREQMRRALHT